MTIWHENQIVIVVNNSKCNKIYWQVKSADKKLSNQNELDNRPQNPNG